MWAALDKDGKVIGRQHCVVGDGGGLLSSGIRIPYYEVPNQHIEYRGVSHGVRVKNWRAVGHVFNVFAIESFVDEMAADEGMDPVDFRMQRMAISPRARACFEKVVQMSDWKAQRPEGRAHGISISERSGSLGAGVAEISLDRASGQTAGYSIPAATNKRLPSGPPRNLTSACAASLLPPALIGTAMYEV